MKSQLIIIICVFVAAVISVDVDKCNDAVPSAIHFASAGCDKLPCPLVRGTVSDCNITLRIPADTDTSTIKIFSKTDIPFWIPFPAPDPNVCHNLLNSYCPLDENEVVVFHLAINILKAYPKTSMILRIQILDERKKQIMCMQVPCIVVDKQ